MESFMLEQATYLPSSTHHSAGPHGFERPSCTPGGLPGYRLRRVLDYIGSHIDDDLTVERLAQLAGMSSRYFASLFRQSTGASPHQFVLVQRVERARERLSDSTCSILDA